MRAWLEGVWYRSDAPPLFLRPLASIYGVIADRIAAVRRRAAQRLPVPVIVVGNVAVGGTGKTPVTLWLVEELCRLGRRPGVLSRGYGGRGPFPREVRADADPRTVGDEPLLIARRGQVPVAVDPDRVNAGRFLLQHYSGIDVLVCDDGLQHYRLARDVELCVVDGARGWGNGARLPAGPLREPAARAQGADLILVNGAEAPAYGPRALRFDLALGAAVNLASGERRALGAFAGATLHAVAGIGNPTRFFAALRARGLAPAEHAFPDHHAYTAADLAFPGDAPVLMTEKDAVKCRAFADRRLWAVPAEVEWAPEPAARLRALLSSLPRPSST